MPTSSCFWSPTQRCEQRAGLRGRGAGSRRRSSCHRCRALPDRDHADSSRSAGPLVQAEDAIAIDGTFDDLDTVIAKIPLLR